MRLAKKSRARAARKTIPGAAQTLFATAILACLCTFAPLADAVADTASLQARKEALFQQMLREPANLDVILAYAEISAELGDNEAAVSAFERLLLFNPNLPRVNLELGALYFRMGSFEMARTYFDKRSPATPRPRSGRESASTCRGSRPRNRRRG